MNDNNIVKKPLRKIWILRLLGWAAVVLLGFLIGLLLSDKIYHPGCKLTVNFAPPSLETDCPSPYETKISFGSSSSTRTLAVALQIVADRTSGKGQARIFVDESVLASEFSSAKVQPPTGAHGTISVVRQLLEDASASDKVDICFALTEGFIVKLR